MALRAAHIGALAPLGFLVLGTACFSSETSTMGTTTATLITAFPEDFRGGLLCGSEPGAMRAYVATLTDISTSPAFRLPSSGPVSCELAVSFAYVVPGHRYVASIDAYDRDDLVPLGGEESGSAIMLDERTGEVVPPVWVARCGAAPTTDEDDGEAAVVARNFRNMRVQGCSMLHRLGEPGETRISLDLSNALFGLRCGDEAGQVSRYRVEPLDPSLSEHESACAEPLVYDVEPGRVHAFDLSAFEANETEPRWRARCQATSQEGMTLPARCAPLSSEGTIRLRVGELLAHHGLACSPDEIESYDVILGDRVVVTGASCHQDAIVGPLSPGSYEPVVVALGRSDGQLVSKLTTRCPAIEVSRGRAVETSCIP